MSTPAPYVGIVLDDYVVDARATLDAMGLGPAGFTVPLVDKDDDTATEQTPALAWCQMDASADSDLAAALIALCSGDLPAISGQWGEEGVIAAADAQEAFGSNHVLIVSIAGIPENERTAWLSGELALHGYKVRPSDL